jgi:hypothetical protein
VDAELAKRERRAKNKRRKRLPLRDPLTFDDYDTVMLFLPYPKQVCSRKVLLL